jgi:hypothetical protein
MELLGRPAPISRAGRRTLAFRQRAALVCSGAPGTLGHNHYYLCPLLRRAQELQVLKAVSLVRKGYFARELPPPFTSAPLGDLLDDDASALPLAGDPTECTRHNLARLSGYRRPLKVPNPRSFISLANVLEEHWADIDAHCKSQTLAISRPVVTRTAERAVRPKLRLGEGPKLRAHRWRGQKFVLFLDVSHFYPTLYTHAIPWALHSKPIAKKNRNKTKGDEIDRALRACQSGQTIGVPIGPDPSFVAAEIVLTAVDSVLFAKAPAFRGYRYIDDYEGAFPSRAEAEEAQGHLESALGDFELVINPFKTRIVELPQPFERTWPREISRFPIRTGSRKETLNDVIGLFSLAAEIARKHPGALKYALRKSSDVPVESKGWRTFQALVWSAVSAEPTTMPTALDLLTEKAEEADVQIDKPGAAEVIETLIAKHAPLRNGSEVAWAIWAAIEFEVDLSRDVAEAITAMEDDFVALLALDAEARGRFAGSSLDKAGWESLIDYDEVLLGPNWLIAYEGGLRGWLSSAVPRIDADPFFSVLRERDISFYEPEPDREPYTGPAGPLPGAPLPESYL